jgi:hypothetical protein
LENAPQVTSAEHQEIVSRLLSHHRGVRHEALSQVALRRDMADDEALQQAILASRELQQALDDQDQVLPETCAILCRQALRRVPDFSAAMVALSMIYRKMAQKPEVALGWVMSALELVDEDAEMGAEEDDPHAWVELGEVRAALGDPVGATGAFLGAIMVDADLPDPTPYLRLVEVYGRLGMLEELYSAMTRARELGADMDHDLDPAWANLVAHIEPRYLRQLMTGIEETGPAQDDQAPFVPAMPWGDGENHE